MPSIYKLPRIPRPELVQRGRETLSKFPQLRRIYREGFIENLSGRATTDNHLLWLLVQDPDDEYTTRFWSEIIAHLNLLGDRGWDRFTGRFRCITSEEIETARIELDIAARFLRAGIGIDFPPDDGARQYEFAADTTPRTYWEIKTVLDIARVRRSNEVLHALRTRLEALKHPFVISVDDIAFDISMQVECTILMIRRQIITLHRNGHKVPFSFEVNGIQISVRRKSTAGEGYIGTIEQGFLFEAEGADRIHDKICSAVPQLPKDGAGIVVIDASEADWLDVSDLNDACFGTSNQFQMRGGYAVPVRNNDGVFSPHHNRRISAVAYYNRRFSDSPRYPRFDIFFNPFARTPISPATLGMIEARQFALLPSSSGMHRITRV